MRARWQRLMVGVGALGAALAPAATAQNASLPPLRKLGPIVARSTVFLADVQGVRALRDGRVLVNDVSSRSLLLFDSTLAHALVIVGPPGAGVPEYARSPNVLLAARGDSSFLVNGPSTIDVIDPAGKVVRSIALPARGFGMGDFLAPAMRATGDRQGRLLYIPPAPFFLSLLPLGYVGDTVVAGPELVPILRFDPASRRTDTVATIVGPRRRQALSKRENGGRGNAAVDPFPMVGDDWTVLSDGAIAVVRLHGYSSDWITPNGVKTNGPPIPHAWTVLTSAKKTAIIDSLRVAYGAARADSTFPADSARYDSLALVAKANPEAVTDSTGKQVQLGPRPVRLQFVSSADLPDSLPPFAPAGMLADADDNLWIENYSPARPGGGIAYDVVNRKGALVDRVELPPNTKLLGFMPGFALLRTRDGKGIVIAKARIR